VAVTQTKKLAPFEQFMAHRRFSAGLAFSPDAEHVYFVSNMSGQFNLWRVGVEGGWPQQLTAFVDETVRTIGVSPHDGTIVFCADRDGDEFHQIYLLDPSGGWAEQITDDREVQHYVGADAFSPDGAKLAYAANARTPTDMEVWVRDLESGEVRPVFGEGKFAFAGAWSPDGTKLIGLDLRNNSDSSIHLIDLESGDAPEITPHDEETLYLPGPWKPDGSGFYFLSDEGREFRGVAFYDVATGRKEWLETPDHDVDEGAASHDGRVLAWLVNEDGWARLKLRDTQTGSDLPDPDLPAGARPHLTGFEPPIALSNDGSRAAVILAGPRRPPEVYVVDTESGESRAVTESWIGGGFAEDELVDVEAISYPTFDDRQIPAWLYRPREANGRVPVVLAIHGGPEAQEHPLYNPLYQYLLSRGVAVLATNIRGSTGYGKSYQRLIQRDWGGGDLKDWDHAVKWLHEQDWVDRERIGVWGGSYGGFAVLTCVTRLPDYWAAAVDIFGPYNLITFAKAVPPTWRRMMKRFVGDPDEDADLLRERSPMTYVENAKAPLLVIQGAKDPRVVKGESDQLVEKLRSLGRTVEYIVFDDEGHGFTKRKNELTTMRASAEWLQTYLLPDGSSSG
jgi:dipeptidyl aminopeptidase/acylaminoacyl peptidase